MRGAHVEVREQSSGEITIEYKQRPLEYSIYYEQEQQQAKVVEAKLLQPAAARTAAKPKQKRKPVPMSHPWGSSTSLRTRCWPESVVVNSVSCESRKATFYFAQLGDISTWVYSQPHGFAWSTTRCIMRMFASLVVIFTDSN